MKYLIFPVDKSSVSFCYYENPHAASDPEPIPKETVQRAAEFARANGYTINFVYGPTEPPRQYRSLIESVGHAKIVPLALAKKYPEGVIVIESGEIERTVNCGLDRGRNVIVRIPREDLPRLASILPRLFGAFQRLNVCIVGLESIVDKELELYGQQLQEVVETVASLYRQGHIFELNIVTDRMMLDTMKNCDAGCEHLTVGPDGRLYLCPGFLYDDPAASVGNLTDGIHIPNAQLLCLDHSPICSRCDAYHCMRCTYLNKKLTLEVNTPSRQQCVASHKERGASEKLLGLLQDVPAFSGMKKIHAIDYNDPFVLLQRSRNEPFTDGDINHDSTVIAGGHPNREANDPRTQFHSQTGTNSVEKVEPGDQPTRDILIEMHNMLKEILGLLRKEHIRP